MEKQPIQNIKKQAVFQKGTATSNLTELVDRYNLLEKSGAGAGTYYHA